MIKLGMLLRRIGRKKGPLAQAIIERMRPHSVFYDLFFGAGGISFAKPLVPFNWANDLDGDVFNLWQVVTQEAAAFERAFYNMPLDETLFRHWMRHREEDPVLAAVRFVMLSNFSIYGKQDCFLTQHNCISRKEEILKLVRPVQEHLQRFVFRNMDFRQFFHSIYISDNHIPEFKRFIYADPPYLDSTNPYAVPTWTKDDAADLFDVLMAQGINFAMSEQPHPFILQLAKKHGLEVVNLGGRRNISSDCRMEEILIVNYPIPKTRQMGIEEMVGCEI